MNEFSLAARYPEKASVAAFEPVAVDSTLPLRLLGDLTREELLAEALYDLTSFAAHDIDSLDDNRLRQEVRWRRAAVMREPARASLARLLSKVSGDTFASLTQGELSPDQVIAKADSFKSGKNGVKILKLPDRVEDHERRLSNLESGSA